MKRIAFACAFALTALFISKTSFGQGMSVNATGATADNSAILDASSTSQGVLVPRMTTVQRNGITSPATGLMIFQTDGTPGFYYYTGSVWSAVGGSSLPAGADGQILTLVGGVPTWRNPLLSVGMSFGGGIVAYILQSGDPGYSLTVQHGLIAAHGNQSTGIQWDNGSFITTGATGLVIGTGQANTTAAVTSQGAGSYAAIICDNLVLGGYSDWYLPSRDELTKLYLNAVAIGGFANTYYWSSSEGSAVSAWYFNFGSGSGNTATKSSTFLYVRAVRAF